MRRLFIIRKDLNMSAGKLAAQVSHCAEAYWMHKMLEGQIIKQNDTYSITCDVPSDVFEEYMSGIFTKTICEARNKAHLMRAKTIADELGLVETVDYGLIYDKCLTELTPEEPDGTTLTGIWFKPLPDDVAHSISKKYQLYH